MPYMPPLLVLQDISLTFGATPLLAGAALAVAAGDRICLVGRNGSGKSTLLRIAAGLVQVDAGERFAQPGATIQYLSQEPDLAGFTTTLAPSTCHGRVSRMQLIGFGHEVYCQPMLQISSQTWNVWVLEALCCSAVT
jgi:ATPase subunit of ABC transporter with duplicated ATPase domains